MKSINSRQSNKKVVIIALDAAETSLIEKWMKEGYLINLASLRSKGAFGKLSSSAEWLAGSPWPTFYTGTLPGEHGLYHYVQWKSDKMEYERPGPEWINAVPFWRHPDNEYRTIAVDVPLTFPPVPFNGIEISGWASHDGIYPTSSYPKEKIEWVKKNFGKAPISIEMGGLQTMTDLFNIKEELIVANQKETELVASLINSEEWDLFICCFSSTHRGGHKLWDATNVRDSINDEQRLIFQDWLRDIYQSCDNAVGKILESVKDDVTVMIFSLHGMGANTSLAEYFLPKMISNIINETVSRQKKENIVKKLRKKIPLEWRSNLKKLLPLPIQDKITAYWRMAGIDWNKTKVFNLLADLQGYIRINLKGREKEGIVEEGDEYNQLCNKIIEGLKTFKDADTMETIVDGINRKDQLFDKGKGFDNLPDLLVKWKFKPAAKYRKIVSSEFGELEWPMPGKNPDGRSGNHRPEGFLIAKGEGFKADSFIDNKHIIDLAPTILKHLNVSIPNWMRGTAINKESL